MKSGQPYILNFRPFSPGQFLPERIGTVGTDWDGLGQNGGIGTELGESTNHSSTTLVWFVRDFNINNRHTAFQMSHWLIEPSSPFTQALGILFMNIKSTDTGRRNVLWIWHQFSSSAQKWGILKQLCQHICASICHKKKHYFLSMMIF